MFLRLKLTNNYFNYTSNWMVKRRGKSHRKNHRDLESKGLILCVLIIASLVISKYKSFKPRSFPDIAPNGASSEINPISEISIEQPPLALIASLPKPAMPQQTESESVASDLVVEFGLVAPKSDGSTTIDSRSEAPGEFSTRPRGASAGIARAAAPSQQTSKPHGYSFWPKRFTLRHVQGWGEGVSFGTDYSTLALLFAPDYRVGRIMPMVDLRGHRFDNNTYAANVGVAGRYIPTPNTYCQILGFNVFWDWREGHLGSYQQIGAGLEVLGKRWDLRANVYAPVSVKKRRITCSFDGYAGGYYAIHRTCEYTSYGFNAEIGNYVVRGKNFFLYAATGPYYLVRKCHNKTLGGEFRLRPQYKDYCALDFSVSHDNVFGTVYQAQIILYVPLYQISKYLNKRPCNLSDQQIYQPIERFEIMPLSRRSCWQTNF
jgi:hypothetical protein